MVALFCTTVGLLLILLRNFGATPKILPPGPPGRATPKKVFPHFLKNLRGRGQFFDCAIRGPPRPVRDKILATVPRPTFPEKNSEFSPKIDFFVDLQKLPIGENRLHNARQCRLQVDQSAVRSVQLPSFFEQKTDFRVGRHALSLQWGE